MRIVLRVITTASIGLAVLISGCEDKNTKKLLQSSEDIKASEAEGRRAIRENKSSVFGSLK